MTCTILIPTYFANSLLSNCIASILGNVSNPKIMIYKNDIGWLKACNKMIADTTDDVILLNDDTLILTDIVKEMSELAYSDDKIGIVGGKALNPTGEVIVNYGIYVGTDGNTAHKYYGKPRNSVKVEEQKAVEGSCLYIKRSVLDKIGSFDEGYGMGVREEVDFCFRAREAGYKVVSSPKAEYIHFISQTHSRLKIQDDNFDYFVSKWGTKLRLGRI